ncbi:hypothetical protein HN51_023976, partial [Arachis hypogaea]
MANFTLGQEDYGGPKLCYKVMPTLGQEVDRPKQDWELDGLMRGDGPVDGKQKLVERTRDTMPGQDPSDGARSEQVSPCWISEGLGRSSHTLPGANVHEQMEVVPSDYDARSQVRWRGVADCAAVGAPNTGQPREECDAESLPRRAVVAEAEGAQELERQSGNAGIMATQEVQQMQGHEKEINVLGVRGVDEVVAYENPTQQVVEYAGLLAPLAAKPVFGTALLSDSTTSIKKQQKFHHNLFVLGPAAHRDPGRVNLGLHKALQFFRWVEARFGFHHTEVTCSKMAIVLARADRFTALWDFLKEMSRKQCSKLVTTETVTCLIKVQGEVGLASEALFAFYRMRQFHCRSDIYAYNTLINALCRVGNFRKARFFLEQMELPGFRCPPNTFTYTILISSYCRHAIQTGCKKATRRRLWEANHLFRIMLFKGFVLDVVTYNALIDGCCKTYRIARALELFDDMKKKGCVPNRVTYNSLIRYFNAVNEIDRAIEMLRDMQRSNHGVPGLSSYTPIIHELCEVGKIRSIKNLANFTAGAKHKEFVAELSLFFIEVALLERSAVSKT